MIFHVDIKLIGLLIYFLLLAPSLPCLSGNSAHTLRILFVSGIKGKSCISVVWLAPERTASDKGLVTCNVCSCFPAQINTIASVKVRTCGPKKQKVASLGSTLLVKRKNVM